MNTLHEINNFIDRKHLAVIGVSENKRKFGYTIFMELKKRGYAVYPVNRNLENFMGQICYKTIQTLPDHVEAAVIVTKSVETQKIVEECLNRNIKLLWIQQGGEPENIAKMKFDESAVVIYNKCILMFAKPSGIHKFHGNLKKIFGGWPK